MRRLRGPKLAFEALIGAALLALSAAAAVGPIHSPEVANAWRAAMAQVCLEERDPSQCGDQRDAASQVAAGQQVFQQRCAPCHGQQAEGGAGPPLVGEGRLGGYRTAKRLFDFVRENMPLDTPGSLEDQQYYDVVAFLLHANSLNPENVVVGPDNLEGLLLSR